MPVNTTSIYTCDNCKEQETTDGKQPEGWTSDFNTGRDLSGHNNPTTYLCRECIAAKNQAQKLALDARKPDSVYAYVDIVFSKDDGANAGSALVFVEIENPARESIKIGAWVNREDGHRVLRITPTDWMASG